MLDLLIIQRFYPNFREGFFDRVANNSNVSLICSRHSPGKIVSPKNIKDKYYVSLVFSFLFKSNIVIFPGLLFELIRLNPKYIVTEGGSNTINNVSVWLYCKLFNKKYIVWDLGRAYKGKENFSFIRKLYNHIYLKLLKDAVNIYVYNAVGKNYFSKFVKLEKIVNLKNTVDTEMISKLKHTTTNTDIKALSQKYSQFSHVMLYVGAVNEHKHLESLKELLNQLSDDYCLLIVGGGEEYYLKSLKKHIGNESRVFFEGYKSVNDLSIYYNISSFAILPGLGGLSINQAMAFKKPVVCCIADGGEKELVKNYKTGFIYPNVTEAAIFISSQSINDWKRMGINAEKYIYNNYSIDNMANTFLKGVLN